LRRRGQTWFRFLINPSRREFDNLLSFII
jgi:hypothetical protein